MDTDQSTDAEVFGEWRARAVESCQAADSFELTQVEIDGLAFEDKHALGWVRLYAQRENRPYLSYYWRDTWCLVWLAPMTGAHLLLPHLIGVVDRLERNFLDPGETVSDKDLEHRNLGGKFSFLIGFEFFCLRPDCALLCGLLTDVQKALVRSLVDLLMPRIRYLYPDIEPGALDSLRMRITGNQTGMEHDSV